MSHKGDVNGGRLSAPFPWFGGKSKVAGMVWSRFGKVQNYVEPFAGSLAVLLSRPTPFMGTETINDKDGLVVNFWRAVKHDPEKVAEYADNPVFECDLTARHSWLVRHIDKLPSKLEGDPDYYDTKIAGWWVWGVSSWIGSGFCTGDGPWVSEKGEDGDRVLVKRKKEKKRVTKQTVNLGGDKGVNKKIVNLGGSKGVNKKIPILGNQGVGVSKRVPFLTGNGMGVNSTSAKRKGLINWFQDLADRLSMVRVCCGDWSRLTGPSVTTHHGLTAVFLDPPYADTADRCEGIYREDCTQVAHDVKKWAVSVGDDPLLRIALCGYVGEHDMPKSWTAIQCKAAGGYGGQGKKTDRGRLNSRQEVVWFSPYCLKPGLGLNVALKDHKKK